MVEVNQENKTTTGIDKQHPVKEESRSDEQPLRSDDGIRENGAKTASYVQQGVGYPPHPGFYGKAGQYPGQPYMHHTYGQYMRGHPYQYGMMPYYGPNSGSTWDENSSGKKRTIDGMQEGSLSNPYAFRRTESNSTTSTSATGTTVGNNTSMESYLDGTGNAELPPLNMDGLGIDRKNSTDSTASTLSVGGFSMGSYDGPKVGAMEDDDGSKRQKTSKRAPLSVDTTMRPPSIGPKLDSVNSSSTSGSHPALFLSLSTSPINTDADATPLKKNTSKKTEEKQSIFKLKSGGRATPLFGKGSIDSIDETLNRHLRGQTFTPLPHLNANSPNFGSFPPQLSWTLTGDSESLGDIGDWVDEKMKQDHVSRPNSTATIETKNMSISPANFDMWKEDRHDGGSASPLPAFFTDQKKEQDGTHHHPHPPLPYAPHSMSHERYGVPPTPMFHGHPFNRSPHMMPPEMYGGHPFMMHPGHHDRIHNLRGRMPAGYDGMHMPHPLQPQFPMTSPIGTNPPREVMWSPHGMQHMMANDRQTMGSPLCNLAQNKRKCVPLKPPIPPKFQGDMESCRKASIPEFTNLVNFPLNISQKQQPNVPEGMRCCVMCGKACPCSNGGKKGKKKDDNLAPRSNNSLDSGRSPAYGIIPSQNKGLCTMCDVNVWIITATGLQIKWCKGCKNFRPWAAFGEKGLATKCLRCRDRQREKYALQKEAKDRNRSKDGDKSILDGLE